MVFKGGLDSPPLPLWSSTITFWLTLPPPLIMDNHFLAEPPPPIIENYILPHPPTLLQNIFNWQPLNTKYILKCFALFFLYPYSCFVRFCSVFILKLCLRTRLRFLLSNRAVWSQCVWTNPLYSHTQCNHWSLLVIAISPPVITTYHTSLTTSCNDKEREEEEEKQTRRCRSRIKL